MLVDLPGAKLPSIAHEAVVLGALGVGAGRAAVHTSLALHRGAGPELGPAALVNLHVVVRGLSAG